MHSYNILHRLVTPWHVFQDYDCESFVFFFYFYFYFLSNFSENSTLSLPVSRCADQNTNLPSNSNIVVVKAASIDRFLKTIP